jgi:hypothetical protein
MIIDLSKKDVDFIQYLIDKEIWICKYDLKNKDKCQITAFENLKESLRLWDLLEEIKTKDYGYGYY